MDRTPAGRRFNRRIGRGEFAGNLFRRVKVKPRLVVERMIGDFMPRVGNRSKDAAVRLERRVLANTTSDPQEENETAGEAPLIRVQGFASRPEVQKLNRSNVYFFVRFRRGCRF